MGKMLLSLLLGPYWIDPNGGCVKDAIEVWCDFTNHSCQTCIEPVKKVGNGWKCCSHNHGNQVPVRLRSREIEQNSYYLLSSLENTKLVSVLIE